MKGASGKFPEASRGNALDKVAKIVGKDRRTLEKAAAKERQREHGKTAPGRKHLRQFAVSDGKRKRTPTTLDKVAKARQGTRSAVLT